MDTIVNLNYIAIVIGAGNNSLTCPCYLAKLV
jgi:phytoene dehydrogenase-like protein